ncbi:Transposon gamma-delta resolvase [Candidatus Brocadiaceae bacterium]|nr:Transposon gamma-delta resolvase [Candidatus Brocadiaceae bacterium]
MRQKKIVVAYCRVSTLEQKKKGYGIDIQIRDASLFAERNGLLVERFYKDEAVSGVKEDRKELRRLMKACKTGKVGVLILPSLDRLSREVRISENLFYEFKKLGVKVLIADMPQYNGESKDVLIRQILAAVAEENRRGIIDRLLKGRQERVRKGRFPGGNLPYGYMRNNRSVIINPTEAECIRLIFSLALGGCKGQKIADELNSRGYVLRNGKNWSQRQVCRILHRKDLYQHGLIRYGEILGEIEIQVILAKNSNSTDISGGAHS